MSRGHLLVMTMNSDTAGWRGDRADLRPGETAFAGLYRDYHHEVLGYCLRRTSRANAEDATAEVFSIAWRKFSEVPSGDRALPWLYGVAYRVLSHQWRSTRRFRNLVVRLGGLGQESAPGPETQVVRRSEDRRVLEAVSYLSTRDQEILRLAGWEELPHDEIAKVLGISVAAVAQRFSRARKRLAKEYDRKTVRPPDVQEGGRR